MIPGEPRDPASVERSNVSGYEGNDGFALTSPVAFRCGSSRLARKGASDIPSRLAAGGGSATSGGIVNEALVQHG